MGTGGNRLGLWAILCGGSLGCLIDRGAPCGPNYRESSTGSCTCLAGFAAIEGRCEPTGDAASLATTNESPLDAGSLTCTTSSDCPATLLCDSAGNRKCIPVPVGLGASCSERADCADYAADYCEVLSSGTCQISGCADTGGSCPGDMLCCDYAVISLSVCVDVRTQDDGTCPFPGTQVGPP